MRGLVLIALASGLAACGGKESRPADPGVPQREAKAAELAARLPSAPGVHGPSLVALAGTNSSDVSDGAMLSDVDSCATCHPDAAAQWSTSAHSFASFGNPIYRVNVELMRHELGDKTSQHCGGCHDMPLMVDGMMTSGKPVPAADLRSHSGVTCRLCHGIQSTSKDGNGSYVWNRTPIEAPALNDPASVARHKAQVSTKSQGTELCVGCHRGFLSPDMGMPVHLSGLDEPGAWRNSAWNGNGMGRVDKVEKKTCIDCHMEPEVASAAEYGGLRGDKPTLASHRFLGGHTWMASMRGDGEHLARLRAKLEGVASIDIAGARVEQPSGATWFLPADGAPVAPGSTMALDVVLRNLLVGHRFPGGVLDIQDTWIELDVTDAKGSRIASSGLDHETNPDDEDTHVLRTLVVDEGGNVLEQHEMASFRTQIQTQTLAARESQVTRYTFTVPAKVALPLSVTAKLRHRSRTLKMQAAVCAAAKTIEGKAFIAGAQGARDVALDPCRPQPITLIAQTQVQLGAGAKLSTARPAWEREYEHGMALVNTVTERLEEAKHVLEKSLADAPKVGTGQLAGPRSGAEGAAQVGKGQLAGPRSGAEGAAEVNAKRARAMVLVQLGWVASKQGRVEDALALVAEARGLLPAPGPAVLDAIATDALARVWKWDEAVAPAQACTERAPGNSAAWMLYARVLGSTGDNAGALAAATKGLELAPRDPDLLRSQATALAALKRPEADAALAAYDRFRSPDNSAELRIACAADSKRCARDRELGHTIAMQQ